MLVEGLYVLLDQVPWKELQNVFNKTYFIETDKPTVMQRLEKRMTEQMGLSVDEA